MSDIKLTYFPAKGRAEISRLILSYSGVKFTDERLSGEQFGAIKSSLPWGQIPVLNYKGRLCASHLQGTDKGIGTDCEYDLYNPGFLLLSLVLLVRTILRVHKLMRLWMLLVIFTMLWLK
jgi:hypothetical protein